MTFHLQAHHGLELGIPQFGKEPLALLGHLGCEFRSRLATHESRQYHIVRAGGCGVRQRERGAAALLAGFVTEEVAGFPRRDHHQQPPQIVAVGKLGKMALLSAAAKAVEGAQGHILLVGAAGFLSLKAFPRQTNQLLEIALPDFLRRGRVACLEPAKPLTHRSLPF
jgi:hypothetical protein